MLGFAAAVFFLIITPGPGVLSTAGVGAGFGFRAGARYVTGLFLGNNLVAVMVVSGLAALVLADPRIRIVLFALSFGYLTYLALRIAFAGARLAFIEKTQAPGVWGGILLQIINPKAYAVSTALFTGFAFLPGSYLTEVALKFVIMNAIWVPDPSGVALGGGVGAPAEPVIAQSPGHQHCDGLFDDAGGDPGDHCPSLVCGHNMA
jgi:threonine/homoserine/homoserine lactone efflux protein